MRTFSLSFLAALATASLTIKASTAQDQTDCSNNYCEKQLRDDLFFKYKLNEADETVSMELIRDDDAWVSIAFTDFSRDMKDSIAVFASPEIAPKMYRLGSSRLAAEDVLELLSPEEQTLMDASCVLNDDGQTVLKFTTPYFAEETPFAMSLGENYLHWAYGFDPTVGYHMNRASFTLTLEKAAPIPLKVGDDVCVTGYIMDSYCIELGHLLDNSRIMTLKKPEEHSFHCLLDVPVCYNSGFNVLGSKDPTTGLHCLGYRIDNTDAVLAAGRAAGSNVKSDTHYTCNTCTGDASDAVAGYRATVKGTVMELGDGTTGVTGQPLLTNIEMLDASVTCETPAPETICLSMEDMKPVPEQAPLQEIEEELVEQFEEPEMDPCSLDFCVSLNDDYLLAYTVNNDDTITMELRYEGNAWVSVAFSTDGMMVGSDAVIGSPDTGVPQKYRLLAPSIRVEDAIELMPPELTLRKIYCIFTDFCEATSVIIAILPGSAPEEQTLIDASVVFEDGETVMKFTKIMKEPNQVEISLGNNIMLGAYGAIPTISYHINKMVFNIDLSSGVSEEKAIPFMSAWLAHGIVAFIAWGVLVPSAVQSAIMRSVFNGPMWFKLHQYLNGTALTLTVVAFAISVAVTSKEGAVHFENSHEKMGLAIFIIAILQVLDGIIRPPTPKSGEEKSLSRKAWEIGHRLGGVALLACGFWQMDSGISLYATKYNVAGSSGERGVIVAYWCWIGFVIAMLVIGSVYFKGFQRQVKTSKDDEVEKESHSPNDTPAETAHSAIDRSDKVDIESES